MLCKSLAQRENKKIILRHFVSCDKFVTLQCAEKRYRRKHLSWQKKSTAAEKTVAENTCRSKTLAAEENSRRSRNKLSQQNASRGNATTKNLTPHEKDRLLQQVCAAFHRQLCRTAVCQTPGSHGLGWIWHLSRYPTETSF